MNWLETIKNTVAYIEEHLYDLKNPDEIAHEIYLSSFYLQKGFKLMTGYSLSEYIKNRRLYLAALDLRLNHDKIIDIAYKYGYETPESFSKAFMRFHGFLPSKTQSHIANINVFLPLKIWIVIQGGNEMDFRFEKKQPLKFIGFVREFEMETAYEKIPNYWNETYLQVVKAVTKRGHPVNEIEQAIWDNHIGEFGISIDDDESDGVFRYMIAGYYKGGKVPSNMIVFEVPALEWAIFKAIGPMPGSLQSVNTKIFKEWLPNSDYQISAPINIEWYSNEHETIHPNYESAIWIPVKK